MPEQLTTPPVPAPEYIQYETDYQTVRRSLFLGAPMGLVENLRNEFPAIWDQYKQLKSLDWEESEIDIASCRSEFKSLPPEIVQLMKRTLAFQYEADSSAAHIARLMYPFVSNTELTCYLAELTKNELLHALAYKFIVESSFENPTHFLTEVMDIKEAFLRLDVVKNVFTETYAVGLDYSLGKVLDERSVRKTILKFWVALFCLERIQFIGSFAITFGLANEGYFVPIAKLVQKIATDEFQVHVQTDKLVLKNELADPEIFALYLEILPEIEAIIRAVEDAELKWLREFLFKEQAVIGGIQGSLIEKFVIYSAGEVYSFFGLQSPHGVITENPLPYMNKWLLIDNNQASPQEENVGNYLLGRFVDDSDSVDMAPYAQMLGITL